MRAIVKNLRGIREAEIDIGSIALVGGDNGAGKSSIALGVAAALMRTPAPLPGMQKQAAAGFLREGESRGYCELDEGAGRKVRVSWPGGAVNADDDAPTASAMACGLESVVTMKPKDAAAALVQLLDLHPTRDQLSAKLPGVDAALVETIWRVVESDGWDAALKRAQERGAKLKGAWEHVTGTAWGAAKAEGWTHPALDLLEGWTEEALEQGVTESAAQLEQLQGAQALDDVQRKFLQEQVDAGAAALEKIREIQPRQNKAQAVVAELRLALRALPQPEQAAELPACPHCGEPVVVVTANELHKPTAGLDEKENARRKRAIDAKRGQLVEAEDGLDLLDREVAKLQPAVRLGDQAEKRLQEAPEGGATAEQIEQARQIHKDASEALLAYRTSQQAATYHDQVKASQAIVKALAPDGVRQEVLGRKLEEFNGLLAELSGAAGWWPVSVDDSLGIWYGSTPYWLLAASEQYRVRVVLQVALTTGILIVDGADILGKGGRNGLMRLLHHTHRPALVCMTLLGKADLPDLEKAGYGRSYWIEEGSVY